MYNPVIREWMQYYGKFTLGNGYNQFRPNDKITGQDMMVLTVRAIEKLGELKAQGASDNLAQFCDKNLLSTYAIDSVEYAVNIGLINGNNGRLNPLGSSTRGSGRHALSIVQIKVTDQPAT